MAKKKKITLFRIIDKIDSFFVLRKYILISLLIYTQFIWVSTFCEKNIHY